MNYMKILIGGSVLCLVLSLNAYAADTPKKAGNKPATASTTEKPAKAAAPTSTAATNKANDRLVLDATMVTGNRELPKVLYIVPWKRADVGNLPGQVPNTLLNEALAPIDRDVFLRQVDYYQVVATKDRGVLPTSPAGAQATPKADNK